MTKNRKVVTYTSAYPGFFTVDYYPDAGLNLNPIIAWQHVTDDGLEMTIPVTPDGVYDGRQVHILRPDGRVATTPYCTVYDNLGSWLESHIKQFGEPIKLICSPELAT